MLATNISQVSKFFLLNMSSISFPIAGLINSAVILSCLIKIHKLDVGKADSSENQ